MVTRVKVKVTEVTVKGQGRRSRSKVVRVKVVGQAHRVKVKYVWGTFPPHRLAGGGTRGHFDCQYFVAPFIYEEPIDQIWQLSANAH